MTTATTMADQLREIARDAESMAERLDRRNDDKPLAIDQFFDLTVPGARLYASRAQSGRWYAYLVMPQGWRPAEQRGWMHNEPQRHFWTDVSGDSEDEVLRKGLIKLLDAKGEDDGDED